MGQSQSFGGASGKGEIYGIAFTFHIILEKETEIDIGGTKYKQRRLLNWLMLNIANAVMDIDWDVYQEENLDVHERHLETWRNIGFVEELKWYGASADFILTFSNYRS
jgi:predicted nucleotidyltransferase